MNQRALIINIGTELTNGKIVNTNGSWMAAQLASCGVETIAVLTIPDSGEELKKVLDSYPNTDLTLITGGLGPTVDDKTREFIADYCDVALEYSTEVEHKLREYFAKSKWDYTESNNRQAWFPKGAVIVPNEYGTAPAFYLDADLKSKKTRFWAFPGVPFELKGIFADHFIPALQGSRTFYSQTISFAGIGESKAAEILESIGFTEENEFDIVCSSLPHGPEVELSFGTYESSPEAHEELSRLMESFITEIEGVLPGSLISRKGASLVETLQQTLIERKETVCVAESCTGGMIGGAFTDLPGSSAVFNGGFICYTNDLKQKLLHVDAQILEEQGAVSQPVVEAMAQNAREVTGSDYALAVSGIAGPDGGSDEKPVGTVWMAVASSDGVISKKEVFNGNRHKIRMRTVYFVMNLLRRSLKK